MFFVLCPVDNNNSKNINNIRYADDSVLLANSESRLQVTVDKVKHHSNKGGLDINVKKVMRVTKTLDEPITIKVDDANLEQVRRFKYIGTQITDDARTETELQYRMIIAKAKYSSMNELITSRQLSMELKVHILNCYVMKHRLYLRC